jgi:hypothetical protein
MVKMPLRVRFRGTIYVAIFQFISLQNSEITSTILL